MAVSGSSNNAAAAAAARAAEQQRIAEERAEAARRRAAEAQKRAAEARARAEAAQAQAAKARAAAQQQKAQLRAHQQLLKTGTDRMNPRQQATLQKSVDTGKKQLGQLEATAAAHEKSAAAEQKKAQQLTAQADQAAQHAATESQHASAEANRAANTAISRATSSTTAASNARAQAANTERLIGSDRVNPRQIAALSKELKTQKSQARALTERAQRDVRTAAGLRNEALAQDSATLRADKTANKAARAAGKQARYASADSQKDLYDAGSLSAKDQAKLFGSKGVVTGQEAGLYDAQKIQAAAKTGAVNGSKMLVEQLKQNSDPAYRATLLQASQPALQTIADKATGDGKPGAPYMREIASNLSEAGRLAGPQGSQVIAANLATRITSNHLEYKQQDGKPVFDDSSLAGALANVAQNGGDSQVLRAIPQQLQLAGKSKDATWNVTQHEDGLNLNPIHDVGVAGKAALGALKDGVSWVGDRLGDGAHLLEGGAKAAFEGLKDAGKFTLDKAGDAIRAINDLAFSPLTNTVNGQIDGLGKGESYGINVSASIDAGLGVKGSAQMTVSHNRDGGYTVNVGADVAGGLSEKLGLGGDAEAGGGARIELSFDNKDDAKRAADTFARIGASAAAPGLGEVELGASFASGDLNFLRQHVSAVELKGEAVTSATLGNLGLKSKSGAMKASFGAEASAQATGGVRVELKDGKPSAVVIGEQVSGELSGSAGFGSAGLNGKVEGTITAQQRVTLEHGIALGDLVKPGNVLTDLRSAKVDASVSVGLKGSGSASLGGETGAKATGTRGRELEVSLNGDPEELLKAVVPNVLHGRFKDAAKEASKDVGIRVDSHSFSETDGGGTLDLGVASIGLTTSHSSSGANQRIFEHGPLPTVEDRINEGSFDDFLETTADA